MLVERIEVFDLPESRNQYFLCIVLSVMKDAVIDFALETAMIW